MPPGWAPKPWIRGVLHPAWPGSPGHSNWAALSGAAAGIFSIEIDPRYGAAQVDGFVESLELFGLGWSWGGPMSLAVPYEAQALRNLVHDYQGTIVRLCIGLEDVDDLRAPLEPRLARLRWW